LVAPLPDLARPVGEPPHLPRQVRIELTWVQGRGQGASRPDKLFDCRINRDDSVVQPIIDLPMRQLLYH
jgi:hypothetical protein